MFTKSAAVGATSAEAVVVDVVARARGSACERRGDAELDLRTRRTAAPRARRCSTTTQHRARAAARRPVSRSHPRAHAADVRRPGSTGSSVPTLAARACHSRRRSVVNSSTSNRGNRHPRLCGRGAGFSRSRPPACTGAVLLTHKSATAGDRGRARSCSARVGSDRALATRGAGAGRSLADRLDDRRALRARGHACHPDSRPTSGRTRWSGASSPCTISIRTASRRPRLGPDPLAPPPAPHVAQRHDAVRTALRVALGVRVADLGHAPAALPPRRSN